MKIQLCIASVSLTVLFGAWAQSPSLDTMPTSAVTGSPEKPHDWSVVGRGPHERVWMKVAWQTNQLGQTTAQANSFVEVATGICYLGDQGQWRDSEDLIELTPDGGAAAVHGPTKAYFSPNLNTADGTTLVTSSNRVFKTRPLGLFWYNAASGKAVLLAALQDCVGELVPPNTLVYKSAFGPLADLRLVYTKSAIENDLVLLQQPKLPDGWDPRTTRLELWHDWTGSPTPQLTPRLLYTEADAVLRSQMVEPDVTDQILDFGELWFPTGAAYSTDGTVAPSTNTARQVRVPNLGRDPGLAPVAKTWISTPEMRVLVEGVRYQDLQPKLQGQSLQDQPLPPGPPQDRINWLSQLPNAKATQQARPPINTARTAYVPKGVVLDFIGVTGGSGNYSFSSGVTYRVSSIASFGGTVTFSPCSIIKYDNNASLLLYGSVVCNGTATSPTILTSVDENLYGEAIGSGNPGYAAAEAIYVYYDNNPVSLNGMKIRWANVGVESEGSGTSLQNSQVEFCQTGVYTANGGCVSISAATQCMVVTPYYPQDGCFTGVFSDYCSDTDHDGLPDSWMMTHFGHPTGQAYDLSRAGDDPDGDGLTNLQEYQLGTDPRFATAPVILSEPLSQTVLAGANVTFTVGALPANGTYVWYRNGVSIPGSGPSLTLNNVQAGDAGSYTVTVYNSAGGSPSEAAILTLATPNYKAIVNGSYSRDKSDAYHSSGDYDSFGARSPVGWSCWMSGMNIAAWTTTRCRASGMVTLTTSATYYDCCIFAAGDVVNVSGLSGRGYNGQFTVSSASQQGSSAPYQWTITYYVPGYSDPRFDELPTADGGGRVSLNGINIMGWPEYGDSLIRKAADYGFDVCMYYIACGFPESWLLAGEYAAVSQTAIFTPHSHNSWTVGCGPLYQQLYPSFQGPPSGVMNVGGGNIAASPPYRTESYGPNEEFFDGASPGDTAESWAFSATAAKYAKIKQNNPGWNVYDIREYLRQASTYWTSGGQPVWREDGGFGYPQIANQFGMPTPFTEANVTLPLEAGPPMEIKYTVSADGKVVSFTWKNFLQTGFTSTMIKLNDSQTIYDGAQPSCTWNSTVTGNATFHFYTKLANGGLSRAEAYTVVTAPNLQPYTYVTVPNLLK